LNVVVLWLERVLTSGKGGTAFWLLAGVAVLAAVVFAVIRRWERISSIEGNKTVLAVTTVIALIIGTYYVDKATRVKAIGPAQNGGPANANTIGQLAPEVTFQDLDGKDATLNQYKGKVVLVNFWATWCDPCYIEIPWLIEIQQKYQAKGFTVLGVSMDEEGKAAVAPFLAKERFNVNGQKLPMNYPIVIGNDNVADKFGGLLGYPTSFLVSKDGKIVKKIQGLISYEELTKAIESQL
jgi:cytochrome c biogenesis protein CcmG/thiol:disulfide interchange protein DsbE